MKILYIIHDYWPEHMAGSENYTHYIAHEMSKLGHRVFVFTAERNYKNDYSVERYVEGEILKQVQDDKRDNNLDGEIPDQVRNDRGKNWSNNRDVNVVKVHKQNINNRSLEDTYKDEKIFDIFVDIFDEIQPDVVHIQHLLNLSVDIVEFVKQKQVPIIFTLHDMWLECFRVKRIENDGETLCGGASLEKCTKCYNPAESVVTKNLFDRAYLKICRLTGCSKKIATNAIRKRIDAMEKVVKNVDLFISPSKYLRDEFVNWGIPEGKIIYSRNGMKIVGDEILKQVQDDKRDNSLDDEISDQVRNDRRRSWSNNRDVNDNREKDIVRFAFTSHMQKLKGIYVLLEACEILQNKNVDYEVLLYGRLSENDEEKNDFLNKVNKIRNVEYKGEFKNTDINKILSDIDYLILPSIWPENAPLVIDEAYINKIPCIVSNIGGMAERVEDGVNGLHFEVGNADDLVDKLEGVTKNRDLRKKFVANVPHVKSIGENAKELEKIYKKMIYKK